MARCSNQTHIWAKWTVFSPMFTEEFQQWNFHLCIIWIGCVLCGVCCVCVDIKCWDWISWCKIMHEPLSNSNAKRSPQNNTRNKTNAMEFYWFQFVFERLEFVTRIPVSHINTRRRSQLHFKTFVQSYRHRNVHDALLFLLWMKIFVKCQ